MGRIKFIKQPCKICGKLISNNGLAKASHRKKHEREKESVDKRFCFECGRDITETGYELFCGECRRQD
jgi:hypothetical protein